MKEPKFKIGDIVKHRATNRFAELKMLVTAVGSLKDANGEQIIYMLSFQKASIAARDDAFVRAMLTEEELEICPAKEP